jgi:hypothetical protein
MRGQIPEKPIELSAREIAIREAKDKLASVELKELQEKWFALDLEEARAASLAKHRSILYAALERRVLEELKKIEDMAGTDQYKGPLGTFSPKYGVEPSVENNETLTEWAKENGFEELLQLPSGKLKEIVTDALDPKAAMSLTVPQRASLPPGSAGSGQAPPGVKLWFHTSVNFTSKKAKTEPEDDE